MGLHTNYLLSWRTRTVIWLRRLFPFVYEEISTNGVEEATSEEVNI
jgi:hypothetical protein